MNQSNNVVIGSYYFKKVRTVQTSTYILPVNIQISEFFRVVKLNIMDDFGFQALTDFELVLAGQQVPGIRHAEDVPAIDINNLNGTLYNIYGMNESFYVRPLVNATHGNTGQPLSLLDPNTINEFIE